jgi:AcrR family transcriptional regulator
MAQRAEPEPLPLERKPRLSTLEQKRSRVTRERLLSAARKLWVNQGFDSSTVEEICTLADVAKGTFYFYFRHKEELLVELALSTAERVGHDTEKLPARMSTAKAIENLVRDLARRSERTPPPLLAKVMVELFRHAGDWPQVRKSRTDLHSSFAELLVRGRQKGDVLPKIDPDDVAAMLSVICLQGMLMWSSNPQGKLEDVLVRRVAVVVRGVTRNAPAKDPQLDLLK